MIDKKPFEGITKGEWKRFEYHLGSSRIYVEEPVRTLVADVHKNRGAIDSDGNERPDDEIATVYNKCDSDLLFSAPALLAENEKLCELVKIQGDFITELVSGDHKNFYNYLGRIASMRAELGMENLK